MGMSGNHPTPRVTDLESTSQTIRTSRKSTRPPGRSNQIYEYRANANGLPGKQEVAYPTIKDKQIAKLRTGDKELLDKPKSIRLLCSVPVRVEEKTHDYESLFFPKRGSLCLKARIKTRP